MQSLLMEDDMSVESAQEFIDRANQDAVIRKLARQRFGDIVNVGREHGFDFELDEFDLAMRERKAQSDMPSGSRCSLGDDHGDEVCQCTPGSGSSGPSVCQCTPGTGGASVCQCTPGQGGMHKHPHDRDSAAVCQCPSTSRPK